VLGQSPPPLPFHGGALQVEDVKVPGAFVLHGLSDTRRDVVEGQGSGQVTGHVVGGCGQSRVVEVRHSRGETTEVELVSFY